MRFTLSSLLSLSTAIALAIVLPQIHRGEGDTVVNFMSRADEPQCEIPAPSHLRYGWPMIAADSFLDYHPVHAHGPCIRDVQYNYIGYGCDLLFAGFVAMCTNSLSRIVARSPTSAGRTRSGG